MEDRKRTIFAVIIALVLVAALLYSFGLNLFSRQPSFEMADPNKSDGQPSASSGMNEGAGVPIEVTTQTVQSVIASLSRYESYYRTLRVTYAWGGRDTAELNVQVWENGGWTHTQTELSSGLTECSITGNGKIWLWYDDPEADLPESVYMGTGNGEISDRVQYIPSYEEVLELDVARITQADYLDYAGHPCIYVEAENPALGYLYRYWVSITNGLLIAAETEKGGVVVYRMESGEVISPMDARNDTFVLPDGTVLYVAE